MFKKIILCSYFNHIYIDFSQLFIDKSIKFKDIGPALRLALTGKTNSPDLVTVIYELGCTITLNRLNYIY